MTAVGPGETFSRIPSASDGSGAEGAGGRGCGHALAACENSAERGSFPRVALTGGRRGCRWPLNTSLLDLGARHMSGRAPLFLGRVTNA